MDLTPEERERIYIEEKARLEVRQTLEAENKTAAIPTNASDEYIKTGLFLLAVLAIGFGVWEFATPKTKTVTTYTIQFVPQETK
jgi:hypothetical protein